MFINRKFILGVLMVSGVTLNTSPGRSQFQAEDLIPAAVFVDVDNPQAQARLEVIADVGEWAVAEVDGRNRNGSITLDDAESTPNVPLSIIDGQMPSGVMLMP
jgi:hypothetical protein